MSTATSGIQTISASESNAPPDPQMNECEDERDCALGMGCFLDVGGSSCVGVECQSDDACDEGFICCDSHPEIVGGGIVLGRPRLHCSTPPVPDATGTTDGTSSTGTSSTGTSSTGTSSTGTGR